MKYFPLVFLGLFILAIGGAGGIYAAVDNTSVGDSAVPTIHRGTVVQTGDGITTSDSSSVPEFGPVATIILVVAMISIVAIVAKTGLRLIPNI